MHNKNAFREWYEKNKERQSQSHKRWREKNKNYLPDRLRKWALKNPHKVRAKGAKRVAAKLRATPPWADFDAIEKFYELANDLTRETGIKYEVDHIVPLQGETVCGLHWEGNLQVISKTENIRKSNRLIEVWTNATSTP